MSNITKRAHDKRELHLENILSTYHLHRLAQKEINFLQLHFMENLETQEIAHLTEDCPKEIEKLAKKFLLPSKE